MRKINNLNIYNLIEIKLKIEIKRLILKKNYVKIK